jgi:hypothetical protein
MATMLDVVKKMLSLDLKMNNPPSSKAAGGNAMIQDSQFQTGFISALNENGEVMVNVEGTPRLCTPTTDETLSNGQKVWTSKTTTGEYLIIGSARQ